MRSTLAYSLPAVILSRIMARTTHKGMRPAWIRDGWAGY